MHQTQHKVKVFHQPLIIDKVLPVDADRNDVHKISSSFYPFGAVIPIPNLINFVAVINVWSSFLVILNHPMYVHHYVMNLMYPPWHNGCWHSLLSDEFSLDFWLLLRSVLSDLNLALIVNYLSFYI